MSQRLRSPSLLDATSQPKAYTGAARRVLGLLPRAEHCQSHRKPHNARKCYSKGHTFFHLPPELVSEDTVQPLNCIDFCSLQSTFTYTVLLNLFNHPWRHVFLLSFYWWRPLRGLGRKALELQCLGLIPGSELTWASHLISLCLFSHL